jgi:tetratricopeptide (TPR) repeat protein
MNRLTWVRALMILLPAALLLAGIPRPAAAAEPAVPLYPDLGDHHFPITTAEPEAQRYFDQGLRLTYAFNHAEAIRAFREAARLDPDCAMCHWGIAYAYGPNINAPMDAEAGRAAHQAVQEALARARNATARERAYIEALAQRYAADPPEDRHALDEAFAQAMGELAAQYPDDLDAATLYAESLMNLRPWAYWTPDGKPEAGTEEIVATLERVIAANPDHPGACHYYIHAVEAVHPERAIDCADRLASLMPGAGHLVHMPAHIYVRVGRYADAVESNVHAIHTDEQYIADQRPEGVYPLGYYPHNYHFLAFAATMAGRSEQAIDAARALSERVDAGIAAAVPELQPLIAHYPLTLVTFGRWEEVLGEALPSEELPLARALVQYAHGVAQAATGSQAEAQAHLQAVHSARDATSHAIWTAVLDVAAEALAGEIAARTGRTESAIEHFRAAVEREDALPYMEPPYWYYPVRHSLGAALLQAGQPEEAERVYREDLERFPANGWALKGLAESLRAQGRDTEADAVRQQLQSAWEGADVELIASRF